MDADRPGIVITTRADISQFEFLRLVQDGLLRFICEHDDLEGQFVAVEINLSDSNLPARGEGIEAEIKFIFCYDRMTSFPRYHRFSINMGKQFLESDNVRMIHSEFLDNRDSITVKARMALAQQ